jgi:hypothetical protein
MLKVCLGDFGENIFQRLLLGTKWRILFVAVKTLVLASTWNLEFLFFSTGNIDVDAYFLKTSMPWARDEWGG